MTREELATITGETTEDTEYTVDIILKSIKPEFVKLAIRAELEEVENQIKKAEASGIIYKRNNIYSVSWNPDNDIHACMAANALLYSRNRLRHMLYH